MWDDVKKRKKRRGRRLQNIDVDEISLVDFPATRHKFMILKSTEVTNTMEELEKLLNELNPEGYKPILKYKDDFPDDLLEAIKILGKYASYGYAGPEGKGIKKAASWPSVTAQLFGTEEEDEGEED
ncbi:hypothetical protein ES703_60040 [subsurface metagenome]